MCLRSAFYQIHRTHPQRRWPSTWPWESWGSRQGSTPSESRTTRKFLGLVQYYARHVPNLSSLAGPLNEMRKKAVRFEWTQRRQSAYKEITKEVARRRVFTSYNESSDLYLATDASEYGLLAVFFHKDSANLGKYGTRFDEPEERVISSASRTLSAAERNYSQFEKEALGIIFGVTNFEKCLMGRRFTIYTDHQPLVKLFDSQQATSATGAARIQRCSL